MGDLQYCAYRYFLGTVVCVSVGGLTVRRISVGAPTLILRTVRLLWFHRIYCAKSQTTLHIV